jgi:hypothetical protein
MSRILLLMETAREDPLSTATNKRWNRSILFHLLRKLTDRILYIGVHIDICVFFVENRHDCLEDLPASLFFSWTSAVDGLLKRLYHKEDNHLLTFCVFSRDRIALISHKYIN